MRSCLVLVLAAALIVTNSICVYAQERNYNLYLQDQKKETQEIATDISIVAEQKKLNGEQGEALDLPETSKNDAADTNDVEFNPVGYTLGPDDVIEIEVRRHPEFSGLYPINLEGKIQYKFIGDIKVTGFTKDGLKGKLYTVLSEYVIDPEIDITILEYQSKVIYVIGEVSRPGKYFMRADSIPVREAVVAAGLPTPASAMRKSRLISPMERGGSTQKYVDLFKLLYAGDLSINYEMQPGDILYVPATVISKFMRVLNPITSLVSSSGSAASRAASMGTVGR